MGEWGVGSAYCLLICGWLVVGGICEDLGLRIYVIVNGD